jgi:DNA-directed RNA polymerase subunit beta'
MANSIKNAFDISIRNEEIRKSIANSIQSQFPIKGSKKTIELENLEVANTSLTPDDFPDQKEAKLAGKSWDYPIYANMRLVDNETGQALDSTRLKIGAIPMMTNRFSTIIDGNEYHTMNQFRLKPGIYTRVKNNGQIVSQFNLEKGFNFEMDLDPEKRIFFLTRKNKHYELYSILKALGVDDNEMRKVWGEEVYKLNVGSSIGKQEKIIIDLYKQLTHQEAPYDKAVEGLKEYFNNTKVSPFTTKITLGESFESVTPKALLATSQKILKVRKGQEEPDQRDSLTFKDLYGVDDLLNAYFEKNTPKIISKLARSSENKDKLREIISSSDYGDAIKNFFIGPQADLSSTTPQTNPLEMLNEWRKTTIMGTGGIQSRHAITEAARDLHPSHIGFLDPIATPDSFKVGITLPLTAEVIKKGKTILTPLLKNGSKVDEKNISKSFEDKTAAEIWETKLGFPDQYKIVNGTIKPKGRLVKGYYKGKQTLFKPSEVEYFLIDTASMYSYTSNLVPFLANTQGNRASMGSRMLTQAVGLSNREKPLVQSYYDDKQTWEDITGLYLQPYAAEAGEITYVDDDYIGLKTDKGKDVKIGLYNYFPLNQNSYLHSTPLVKVGDKVKKDEVLADHNFSKDSTLAVGANVNVAYMPWKGFNFEDGVVVTESFADKFTSSSMVKKSLYQSKEGITNKSKFRTIFPDKLTPKNYAKLDAEGIIKEGERVEPNDILVSYMEPRDMTSTEMMLKKMSKTSHLPYVDKPLEWPQDKIGVVKYVKKMGRSVNIWIVVDHPMVVGDKISGRYGNKGIITKIIPDSDAPHNKDGKRVDLIMSPAGVPGRINPSQLLETAAGKWAEKTGNNYIVKNFSGEDSLSDITNKLKKEKIEINETLFDGKDGKPFENKIFTGNQYILRLMHDVEKKHKARERSSYDLNLQPAAGKSGGQSLDPMTMYAMVAHGASKNLRDATLIKGQKNEEIWQALQLGLPLPTPKTNFVWDKLVAHLQNAGVNVNKNGNYLITSPFTDKQLKNISSGEIKNARDALRGKNLAPIKGGLFDPDVTGGMQGSKWAHINLNTKMPHPMFEDAIIKITGLTRPKFETIMNETYSEDGVTGAKLIQKKLNEINLKSEIRKTKAELKKAPKSKRSVLNKKYKHLEALKTFEIKPSDLMISKFPVMPSKFRPIYPLPSGDLQVSPINHHYRQIAQTAYAIKTNKDLGFDDELSRTARKDMYRVLKEAVGLQEPLHQQMKRSAGIVKTIAGSTPKEGLAQRSVWAKRQDVSGRSTVTVDPSLGLDEAGVPVDMAKTIYKPFIVKEMLQMGFRPLEALEDIKNDGIASRKALLKAMDKRPILLNRAPTLHKHGIQAFKPILEPGKDIKTNPLINAGFNLDYDGDTMAVHVPVTDEAVDEAWGMLPSKNVFKAGDNSVVHAISKDYQLGLYYLTVPGRESKKRFKTVTEARDAGLGYTDVFSLNGKKTTIGIQMVNAILPKQFRDYDNLFDSRKVNSILEKIANETPEDFDKVISGLKDLGNTYGHERGSSVSLDDLRIDNSIRDKIIKKWELTLGPNSSDKKKIEAYKNAKTELKGELYKKYSDSNKFYEWLKSGALGKEEGVIQMIGMPGILQDTKGEEIPIPITKSYGEGLDSFDYWNSIYGVRKGTIDRAVNTQESGELNKRLLANTRKLLVIEEDCKTTDGVDFYVTDKNILDRTSAFEIDNIVETGQLITPDIQQKLKKSKLDTIVVRSPLTCETSEGVCQKCYGLMAGGNFPPIGTNVGVLDGQAISERSTQLTMRTFHTGGAADSGGGAVAGFKRLEQIFKVPETVPGKATLAQVDGQIDSVKESPIGGKDMLINGINHYIPQNLDPTVKAHQTVTKGQKISTGVVKPQELADLKNFKEAQRGMVQELDDIYENKFYQKTFETAIRGVTDNAEILEPGDTEFLPGDKVAASYIKKKNKALIKDNKTPAQFKEYFKSIEMLTDDGQDWLDRLSNVHLKSTIKDMASTRMASNIHGHNPLPAYMYGLEFAKDPKSPY